MSDGGIWVSAYSATNAVGQNRDPPFAALRRTDNWWGYSLFTMTICEGCLFRLRAAAYAMRCILFRGPQQLITPTLLPMVVQKSGLQWAILPSNFQPAQQPPESPTD